MRVFVFTYQNDKQTLIPRKETKHLDGEPSAIIDEWIARWSNQFEKPKAVTVGSPLPKKWDDLIEKFGLHLTNLDRQLSTISATSD